VKNIKKINELNIPKKHQNFIIEFLKQARDIKTFDKIEMFILFGSCAREEAKLNSDIDIMVIGKNIGDESLFELYDCTWQPDIEETNGLINSDVLVNDIDFFNTNKKVAGSLQWRIAKDGVILNGLLQTNRKYIPTNFWASGKCFNV